MMFSLDVLGQFCKYGQHIIAHLCMWVSRGGTIRQYWATNIMHLWWLWVGKVHCTVCTLSWGWHGPEPARWGANNGMHTAHCTLLTAL